MARQRPKSVSSRRSRGRMSNEFVRRHKEAIRAAQSPGDLLGRFSDALSILAVAQGSLAAKEISGTGDEEVVLRQALCALRTIYSEFDRASRLVAPT